MRPYVRESASDLGDLAHAHWDDLTVLVDLIIELFQRRTEKARSLRIELIDRVGELVREGFPWPSTDAPAGTGQLETGWPEKGLLSLLGYRVGVKGLPQPERQEILDAVYREELPPVDSPEYMAEWGRPSTALRLQKLAESIAALTRNAKRRSADTSNAVEDWEVDLDYLRREYYVGRYNFVWPGTYSG